LTRRSVSRQPASPVSFRDRGRALAYSKLAEEVLDVEFDRGRRQSELAGDQLIGMANAQFSYYIVFALAQHDARSEVTALSFLSRPLHNVFV
jgi:hypothetical protein